MKRYKHSLSNYRLSTFDMGELVPVGILDVLPGDSIRVATSALIRVSPLMAPVMHPVTVRIHHWFVPYRILWDDWEDFITGGPDGEGAASAFPVLPGGTVAKGTVADHLGIPVNQALNQVSALPFKAYNLIYNEFYRDQDLIAEVDTNWYGALHNIAWEKDYFTACRPWTQKGPDVIVPIGQSAPVRTNQNAQITGSNPAMRMARAADGASPGSAQSLRVGTDRVVGGHSTNVGAQVDTFFPENLYADLSQAVSPSINDFRLAFALQRYQEARAAYGSRYTEYLRYLGVKSSDARLQRPEYLGGGRTTISFSEVLRTGAETAAVAGSEVIGEMKGHGISALRSRRFIRYFEEHGVMLTLASIRPKAMYTDGLHRMWSKRTKEDYWQKELEQIGSQEVFNREVYAAHTTPTGIFGYNDRYSEYRHMPSTVAGDFRDTLNDWHLARQFSADPALNESFVECVPSKRIHAEQTQDVIWGMFSHQVHARRLVGHSVIGRII